LVFISAASLLSTAFIDSYSLESTNILWFHKLQKHGKRTETNSLEQSPSWQVDSHSASEETPPHFMEVNGLSSRP